jgi:uncharacterized protein (TIGR02452 family)
MVQLKDLAQETLRIIEDGAYISVSGKSVSIADAVLNSISGTTLYRPEDFASLSVQRSDNDVSPKVEVTGETTAQAARRLVEEEGIEHVVALNFASAKNPGGGFLGGAKAQEEDLARCSALYTCQTKQPAYYEANRKHESMLYTDHMIYSRDVPFFRDDALQLLEAPFVVSIITSPAPNAGEALARDKSCRDAIRETLVRRSAQVLTVAAHHKHRVLVLGAWGCGVFRNDPTEVADIFAKHLTSDQFRGAFDRVVFAIYDRSYPPRILNAFVDRLGSDEILQEHSK